MSGWRKALRAVLASLAVAAALLYALVSMLQEADTATIVTAKEVGGFIDQYCAKSGSLPAAAVLRQRFPDLNTNAGWFFYTDDKTYLIVQYPVRWSNREAIGRPKRSEFTATIYAYTVDYHCRK